MFSSIIYRCFPSKCFPEGSYPAGPYPYRIISMQALLTFTWPNLKKASKDHDSFIMQESPNFSSVWFLHRDTGVWFLTQIWVWKQSIFHCLLLPRNNVTRDQFRFKPISSISITRIRNFVDLLLLLAALFMGIIVFVTNNIIW